VWKIEPIATMTEDDIVTAIAPTIQRYLSDNIAPAAAQRQRRRTPRTARSSPAQN
jgi:hypothetical protein